MNGCTLPGRMSSSVGAVCFGETTDTGGRAVWAVSAFRVVRALTRDQMPDIKRAATASSAIARASHRLRGEFPTATLLYGTVCPPFGSYVSISSVLYIIAYRTLPLNLHDACYSHITH